MLWTLLDLVSEETNAIVEFDPLLDTRKSQKAGARDLRFVAAKDLRDV